MDRKRRQPAIPQWYPEGPQRNSASAASLYSVDSFSVSARKGTGQRGGATGAGCEDSRRPESRYGVGWGMLSDRAEPLGLIDEGVGRPAMRKLDIFHNSGDGEGQLHLAGSRGKGTSSPEYWSPLQQLSMLAATPLQRSNVSNAARVSRWPLWASPFLGLDLKRLLGLDLGSHGRGNGGGDDNEVDGYGEEQSLTGTRKGSNVGTGKCKPSLWGGKRSKSGLARWRPISRCTPLLRRRCRKKSFGRLQGSQASSARDSSTVSLEIATSDLLHGDFSKIRVKYCEPSASSEGKRQHPPCQQNPLCQQHPQFQQQQLSAQPPNSRRSSSQRSAYDQSSSPGSKRRQNTARETLTRIGRPRSVQTKRHQASPRSHQAENTETKVSHLPPGKKCRRWNPQQHGKQNEDEEKLPNVPQKSPPLHSLMSSDTTPPNVRSSGDKGPVNLVKECKHLLPSDPEAECKDILREGVPAKNKMHRWKGKGPFFRYKASKFENEGDRQCYENTIANRSPVKSIYSSTESPELVISSQETEISTESLNKSQQSLKNRYDWESGMRTNTNDFKPRKRTKEVISPQMVVEQAVKEMKNQQALKEKGERCQNEAEHSNSILKSGSKAKRMYQSPRRKDSPTMIQITGSSLNTIPGQVVSRLERSPSTARKSCEAFPSSDRFRRGAVRQDLWTESKAKCRSKTGQLSCSETDYEVHKFLDGVQNPACQDEKTYGISEEEGNVFFDCKQKSSTHVASHSTPPLTRSVMDSREDNLLTWQAHRLEAISEASGELDGLLSSLISSSLSDSGRTDGVSMKPNQCGPATKVDSKRLTTQRDAQKLSPPCKEHQREQSEVNAVQTGVDISQPLCKGPPAQKRRTRESIWKSEAKKRIQQKFLFSSVSPSSDVPRRTQQPSRPRQKYVDPPSRHDQACAPGDFGVTGLRSERHSSFHNKGNAQTATDGQIRMNLPTSRAKKISADLKRMSQKESGVEVQTVGVTKRSSQQPLASKTASVKSSSDTDLSDIKHTVHLTESLTVVLEGRERKAEKRNRKVSSVISFMSVADRNTTHGISDRSSQSSGLDKRIELTTRSHRGSSLFQSKGSTNNQAHTPSTSSPGLMGLIADDLDSPVHPKQIKINRKEVSERAALYSENKIKEIREVSHSDTSPTELGRSLENYENYSIDGEDGHVRLAPLMSVHDLHARRNLKLSAENCQTKRLRSGISISKSKERDQAVLYPAIHPVIDNHVVVSVAPLQHQTNSQQKTDTTGLDVKRTSIRNRTRYNKTPETEDFRKTMSGHTCDAFDRTNLPPNWPGLDKEKISAAARAYKSLREGYEASGGTNAPKTSLCSPRTCRLHGSDVGLCENRPVQQTITHQQYTMEELRLAGYSFYQDELAAGGNAATLRSLGTGGEKGSKSFLPARGNRRDKDASSALKREEKSIPGSPRKPSPGGKAAGSGVDCTDDKPVDSPSASQRKMNTAPEDHDPRPLAISERHETVCGSRRSQRSVGTRLISRTHGSNLERRQRLPPDPTLKDPKPTSKRELMDQIRSKIGLGHKVQSNKIRSTGLGVKRSSLRKKSPPHEKKSPGADRCRPPAGNKAKGRAKTLQGARDKTHVSKTAGKMARSSSYAQNTSPQTSEEDENDDKGRQHKESCPETVRFHFGKIRSQHLFSEEPIETLVNALEKPPYGQFKESEIKQRDIHVDIRDNENMKQNQNLITQPNMSTSNNNVPSPSLDDKECQLPDMIKDQYKPVFRNYGTKNLSCSVNQWSNSHLVSNTDTHPVDLKTASAARCAAPHDLTKSRDFSKKNKPGVVSESQLYSCNVDGGTETKKSCSTTGPRQPNACTYPPTPTNASRKSQLQVDSAKEPGQPYDSDTNIIQLNEAANSKSDHARLIIKPQDPHIANSMQPQPLAGTRQNTGRPKLQTLTRSRKTHDGKSFLNERVGVFTNTPRHMKREGEKQISTLNNSVTANGEVDDGKENNKSEEQKQTTNINALDDHTPSTKHNGATNSRSITKNRSRPWRRNYKGLNTSEAKPSNTVSTNQRNVAYKSNYQHKTKIPLARKSSYQDAEQFCVKKKTCPDGSEGRQLSRPDKSDACLVPLPQTILPLKLTSPNKAGPTLPLQAFQNAGVVLTCTQVDCLEATPYRKTKLAWCVSPESKAGVSQVDSGKRKKGTDAGTVNTPKQPAKVGPSQASSTHLPDQGRSKISAKQSVDGKNLNLLPSTQGSRSECVSERPKSSNQNGVASTGSQHPLFDIDITKCSTNEGVEFNDRFLNLPEMTSEEAEMYKLPDSLPKMIGSTDVSDHTQTKSDDRSREARADSQVAFNVFDPSTLSTDRKGHGKISAKDRVSGGDTEGERGTATENVQTDILQTKPVESFHPEPSRSTGSMPDPVSGLDASLGEVDTPQDELTSKSGLSDLAVAAASAGSSKNPRVDSLKTVDERKGSGTVIISHLRETVAHRDSCNSFMCRSEGKRGRIENKGEVSRELAAKPPGEEENAKASQGKGRPQAAKLSTECGEREFQNSAQTDRWEMNGGGDVTKSKSQTQSQSCSLSRSHQSRSVEDSATNTLERLLRKRLVSGRSHRRFGGSTSPKLANSLARHPSISPDPDRLSPRSPGKDGGEIQPKDFLRKPRPRPRSLLASAEDTGYVTSAAHHSFRQREFPMHHHNQVGVRRRADQSNEKQQ